MTPTLCLLQPFFLKFLKVGGVLVGPFNDRLLKVIAIPTCCRFC